MNRLYLPVLLLLTGLCVSAQTSGTITISSLPNGARFMVDGQVYSQAATLNWPAGSTHLVVFITDPPVPNQTANGIIQTSSSGAFQYSFSSWTDNLGLLVPGTDPVQTITANPGMKTLTANVTVSYRVMLDFFSAPDGLLPTCGGAPGAIPTGLFRPGLVY